jgi:hypothetical protein
MKLLSKEATCCKKIVEYPHGKKPELCPYCKSKYWDKPEDERNLFLLQEVYLENGRKKEDLGKLYHLVYVYAKNLIKNNIKNKKIFSEEEMEDKAEDTTTIFFEKYLKNNDFKIDSSFGGFIGMILKGVLYSKKLRKIDSEISLEGKLDEDFSLEESLFLVLENFEEKEKMGDDQYSSLFNFESEQLATSLYEIIYFIYNKIKKYYPITISFLFLLGFDIYLKVNDQEYLEEFFLYFDKDLRHLINSAKMVLRNYLLETNKD